MLMEFKFFSKLQYLVKESLHVTDPQLQISHLIWICCNCAFIPPIIVFKCYVVVPITAPNKTMKPSAANCW